MAYSSKPSLVTGQTFKNKDFYLSKEYLEMIGLWNRLHRDPNFDLAMEVMRENPEAIRLWELFTEANNIQISKSDDLHLIRKEVEQMGKVIESLVSGESKANKKDTYVPITDRKLRVFLCHSSQDKPIVRELYRRLLAEGWIDPWLDERKLLPGQDWRTNIEEAVESSEVVIICLSNHSVNKEGFVQKEMRYAREISLEKPDDTIFLVPIRLDECDVPRGLRFYQWGNYFDEQKEQSYIDLLESLKIRQEQILRRKTEELSRKQAAEEKARQERVEQSRREVVERAKREAAENARKEAEEKARLEAEERAQKEKEKLARKQAEETAHKETVETVNMQAQFLVSFETLTLDEKKNLVENLLDRVLLIEKGADTRYKNDLPDEIAEEGLQENIAQPRPINNVSTWLQAEAKPEVKTNEPIKSIFAIPRKSYYDLLAIAREAINNKDISKALEIYSKLIKKGALLEDMIKDLREVLYKYPKDVSIWQCVGDAYMRANRLEEALDAYTKAEDLLR